MFIQLFILILFAFAIFYYLDFTCNDFKVPENLQNPGSMKKWEKDKENRLMNHMKQTRLLYPKQDFEGSSLRDGFHFLLHPFGKWENGQIVMIK